MISFLRRFVVDSWVGRVLALVIFIAFVTWGVGDVISNLGDDPSVAASVGSRKISARELATALQAELPQMAQRMGAPDIKNLPPQFRNQMAQQVLQRLIGQAQVLEAGAAMGLVVPDSAVREEIFAMPYFKGKDGKFDRKLFDSRMAQAGMTEQRLIGLVRDDLAGRGVLDATLSGAHVPDVLVSRTYGFETETRVLDVLHIPFASEPMPQDPDEATLRRFYTNHPWLFVSPELRHARVVVLSPDTVASTVSATDEEMHRLYDAQKERFHLPELRSVQLVTAPDETQAQAIATVWRGGATWAQVQAAAKDSAAVEFDDARESSLPSEALQKLVFSAPADTVQGPVKVDTGWVVFHVVKVTPPKDTSFDDAKASLKDQIVKARAPETVNANVKKLQDAIAGGGLDAIPSDLGAAAAAGTLDSAGMTKDGEPAPLPASGALRAAVVARIFSQAKGAPPVLTEATAPAKQGQPGQSLGWYAVSVDDVTASQPVPFDQARARVLAAWRDEARRHAADEQATGLYLAAQQQGGIAAVAPTGADLKKGVFASRARPPEGLPEDLAQTVLRMPAGRSVMGEDAESYIVVTATAVQHPDPAADSLGFGRVRDGLTDSLTSDLTGVLTRSLGERYKAKIVPAGVKAALDMAGFGDGS